MAIVQGGECSGGRPGWAVALALPAAQRGGSVSEQRRLGGLEALDLHCKQHGSGLPRRHGANTDAACEQSFAVSTALQITVTSLTWMLMPGRTVSCGAGPPRTLGVAPLRCSSTCSEAAGCWPGGGWNSGGCDAADASRTTDCSSCVRSFSCANVACAAGLQHRVKHGVSQ